MKEEVCGFKEGPAGGEGLCRPCPLALLLTFSPVLHGPQVRLAMCGRGCTPLRARRTWQPDVWGEVVHSTLGPWQVFSISKQNPESLCTRPSGLSRRAFHALSSAAGAVGPSDRTRRGHHCSPPWSSAGGSRTPAWAGGWPGEPRCQPLSTLPEQMPGRTALGGEQGGLP